MSRKRNDPGVGKRSARMAGHNPVPQMKTPKKPKSKAPSKADAAKKKAEQDAAAKKKAEQDAAAKKKADEEAAAKKKAEEKPPAAKNGETDNAKCNCPAAPENPCDVTSFKMTLTPQKHDDATNDASENKVELETKRQLRADKIKPKDQQKISIPHLRLLQRYDLVIETIASYFTAEDSPETTIDVTVEAEWEGKCAKALHPLLHMRPVTTPGEQTVKLDPAAADGRAELVPTEVTWKVGTQKATVTGLIALAANGDLVPEDDKSPLRGLFRLIALILAMRESVDIEFWADAEGVAIPPRTPNKHLNGLVRIYRDTEISLELSVPRANKYTQKKERGQARESVETEEKTNAGGKQRWELVLKIGKLEIKLLDDETSIKDSAQGLLDAAKQEAADARDTAKSAEDVWDDAKSGAKKTKKAAKKAWGKSKYHYKKDARKYKQQHALPPGAKYHEQLAQSVKAMWAGLKGGIMAQRQLMRDLIEYFKKAPKLGWHFEWEFSFLAVTVSAVYARMSKPGPPVLDRLVPLVHNGKLKVEGVVMEGKAKLGFGLDVEFDPEYRCELSVNGVLEGKVTLELECSIQEDTTSKFGGEVSGKLEAVAEVIIGKFKFTTNAYVKSGLAAEGSVTWKSSDLKVEAAAKVRTLPVSWGYQWTHPLTGEVHTQDNELVKPKALYNEKWILKDFNA